MATVITEEIINKIAKYLDESHGWTKEKLATALYEFEKIHGSECVEEMSRFVDWAKEQEREDGWIAAQLGHDLNERWEECMSPRTAGY